MSDEKEIEPVKEESPLVTENSWRALRQYTSARIGLGRAGHSLPTAAHLEFQLAHAQARDAVHAQFDSDALSKELQEKNFEVIQVSSQATLRSTFLRQPDMGRRLSFASRQLLEAKANEIKTSFDAVFVLGDGLSAQAIHRHAIAVFTLTVETLLAEGWKIAPVIVANGSRVALGDEIGSILRAEQVAILIGERPGLSAADSLGIYLTYNPQIGRLESERNCISNIRPEGLCYQEAAATLLYLMNKVRKLKMSGVQIKDERE